jgi:hypothetical protein
VRTARRHLAALVACAAFGLAVLASAASAAPQQPVSPPDVLMAELAAPQGELTATDGANWDFFGLSVAVSGDTAVVGAYQHQVGSTVNAGAAYVFTRTHGAWSFQRELNAPSPEMGEQFGYSVAVSGDTVLVGAPYNSLDANTSGAVFVYTRSGTDWALQDILKASDKAIGDHLGYAVALSGDTAVAGAPGRDSSRGAVYVFTRSGSSWTQQTAPPLTAGDAAADDAFGSRVAMSGDTLVTSALYHAVSGKAWAGAAYVFARTGTTWAQQQELTAGDGAAGDQFGFALAAFGDTLLVGVPLHTTPVAPAAGAAYVFTRTGGAWAQQQELMAPDAAINDGFGYGVGLCGDMAVVGAPGHAGGGPNNSGAAYVFARRGSTWTQQSVVTASDGADGDWFGSSAAVSGGTTLIGAASKATYTGAAYPFLLDGTPPTTTVAGVASGWSAVPITATLTVSDDLTGVAGIEYRLQGAASWQTCADSLVISTQGISTWEYRSRDMAGNVEAARSFTVQMDSVRPTTRAYAASVRKGKKVKLAYRVSDAVPGCGKAVVTLKIYKGKRLKKTLKVPGACACNAKRTCSWRCTLAPGGYTIKVYARDIAGNAQSKVGSARLTVR